MKHDTIYSSYTQLIVLPQLLQPGVLQDRPIIFELERASMLACVPLLLLYMTFFFRFFSSKGCVWGHIDNYLQERFWTSAQVKDSFVQGLYIRIIFTLKYPPENNRQPFSCAEYGA